MMDLQAQLQAEYNALAKRVDSELRVLARHAKRGNMRICISSMYIFWGIFAMLAGMVMFSKSMTSGGFLALAGIWTCLDGKRLRPQNICVFLPDDRIQAISAELQDIYQRARDAGVRVDTTHRIPTYIRL